jgi:xanthine dehydrogenase YagS FAD-binding subunit
MRRMHGHHRGPACFCHRRAACETFRDAAEIALAGAVGREHNHFKIELAKRTIVSAFANAREAKV